MFSDVIGGDSGSLGGLWLYSGGETEINVVDQTFGPTKDEGTEHRWF